MTDPAPDDVDAGNLQRQKALSRWDNAGGTCADDAHTEVPELSDAELVHLRVRVIALENLVIALLAEGTERQRALAREMAAYILPRPGATQHPLTIRAAHHMTDMLDRALHVQKVELP